MTDTISPPQAKTFAAEAFVESARRRQMFPTFSIIERDEASTVLASLDTLREIERKILTLRYYEDCSFAEISRKIDPGVVIILDTFDPKKHYAVLAEFNLHALINAHAGVSKSCALDIPVRECWSASDGRDIPFSDWDKLSKR